MPAVRREWGSILKRGGRYYVRYRDAQGKRRWKVAGSRRSDATSLMARLREQVELERRGIHTKPMTPAEWWTEEYVDILASRLKPSGVRTAQVHFQRLADWLFDERRDPLIRDVTRADAEAFVAFLIAQGLQPSYARRLVSTLRRAWTDAITRGLAHMNPWSKLKIAAPKPTRVPWVTMEQLEEIYAAMPASAQPHIILIGETGLRAGEAQALRWRDVDLGASPRVEIREGKTTAAQRSVPLTPRAVALVQELYAEGGVDEQLVLPRISQQWMRRALAMACARASVERLKVHSLRHVYASHLVQLGVPPSTVARLLGHADGGALVMRLYGRWMPHDAESRAVALLADRRSGPDSRTPPPSAD